MTETDSIPRKKAPAGADLAVGVTDDLNAPWLSPGDTMFLACGGSIAPGELGVFIVGGQTVCRQYVEDSEGNVYLFAANRARRGADIRLPAGSARTAQLLARVLLPFRVPLPGPEPPRD